MRARIALVSIAFISLIPALAAASPPPPVDLGFLNGEWTIEDAAGAALGRSVIVEQADNAVLYEVRTIGDRDGQPLWFVNSERQGGWEQLFLGPAATVRAFDPVSAAGAWPLILGASVTLRDGTPGRFRMTIEKFSDDHSRRVLELSKDEGASWSTVFDYHYRRAR